VPVSRALAQRIDRLARRAHAFHRFAHHPLCDRYAGELVQLSRRRSVCRGCSCFALAAVSGGAVGLLAPLPRELSSLLGALALAGALLALRAPSAARARDAQGAVSAASAPRGAPAGVRARDARPAAVGAGTESGPAAAEHGPAPARWISRPGKLWTRALPAFALAWSVCSLLRVPSGLDLSLAALLLAGTAWLRAGYRRRGPDRTPCLSCPERALSPCSGFRAIVHAERAFRRRAQQLLDEEACAR
jgi:hypothetical protein